MILPSGFEAMTEEELAEALVTTIGYDQGAAEWLAGVIKGTITPESPVL